MMKTAIVTFLDAYPAKSGAGVVIYDFFNSQYEIKNQNHGGNTINDPTIT